MKKSFLFVTCEEALHICDKSQYDEANSWEKLKLSIRLSWCKVTRAYYKRNTKLTDVLKSSQTSCLDPKEREAMASKFEEELKKH